MLFQILRWTIIVVSLYAIVLTVYRYGQVLTGDAILLDNCEGGRSCVVDVNDHNENLKAIQKLHQSMFTRRPTIWESNDSEVIGSTEKWKFAFRSNENVYISSMELTEIWINSEVYRWSSEETASWVKNSVNLPQYAAAVTGNEINGTHIARLATGDNKLIISVLGIINPIHRQLLILNAVLLFLQGPQPSTSKMQTQPSTVPLVRQNHDTLPYLILLLASLSILMYPLIRFWVRTPRKVRCAKNINISQVTPNQKMQPHGRTNKTMDMTKQFFTNPKIRIKGLSSFGGNMIIANMLKLQDIATITEDGVRYPLLFLVLQDLKKQVGKLELLMIFKKSKVDLLKSLPVNEQTVERLNQVLQSHDLNCLQHSQLQHTLRTQIHRTPDSSQLMEWIIENVGFWDEAQFVKALIPIIVEYAYEHEQGCMKKFVLLMRWILNTKMDLKLMAIYVIQEYYFSIDFPGTQLVDTFDELFESNVIEREVFYAWRDDINHVYKGKQQALSQASLWLQNLRLKLLLD